MIVRKKMMIITSRFPYPLEKGDKLRAYYQIKELSKYFEIHLISLYEKPLKKEYFEQLKQYCQKIFVFKLNKLSIILNVIKAFFTGKPLQVGYFYNEKIKKEIHEIFENEKPDFLYVQLIRMAEYAKGLSVFKILDYQDAFSKGIFRRIERASLLLKPILKMEYKRLVKYESSMFGLFNKLTIISEQDRELIEDERKYQIIIVRNGVDFNYFQKKNICEKEYDILFTGNMSYPPNVEAAVFLAEKLLPALRKNFPYVKLLIAGANPTLRVKNLANEYVHVSGWVDDIRVCYEKSKIFIAPMFLGIGLQNKLLEAMAMQLPCITSSLSNNALGAIHGKEIFVANSLDEYVEYFEKLTCDPDLYNFIVKNAYNFVKNNFDWEKQTSKLIELFQN